MNRTEIFELVKKYNRGQCTEEEVALLETWYLNEDELYHTELTALQIEADLLEVYKKLPVPAKPVKRLWPRIAAAAAILLVLGAGLWFYTTQQTVVGPEIAIKNDIGPGRNTATLTLANGKVIKLSDAKAGVIIDASKLTYNDGSSITDAVVSPAVDSSLSSLRGGTTKQSYLTATTPRGGTYQVILPDGTKVWLNAASTLKFPTTFAGITQRKVILSGEAYFEVATSYVSSPLLRGRRAKQSFIVETNNQQVEVLGTHFNISSYTDESSTKTTLLEGSVRISALSTANMPASTILKPGEQAQLANNRIEVKAIETSDAIAWKNGYFMFNNETLQIALAKVARWYNVSIVYEDPSLKNETLFGSISRYKNISDVLKMIERAEVVKITLKENTVYIKRNKKD